ncbi:MAG: DUF6249 domain-containing protein [Caulobacteraceae bacterium]
MIVAVQILIALIVPGLVFMFTAFLRSRERMRLLDVILQTSQSGSPVSPDLLRALPGGRDIPTPQLDFRRGVMLIAVGLAVATVGLCVYFAVATSGGEGAIAWGVLIAAFGAIPACIGAALVILSREARGAIGS